MGECVPTRVEDRGLLEGVRVAEVEAMGTEMVTVEDGGIGEPELEKEEDEETEV